MPADLLAHVLSRVDTSGGVGACWEWQGARDPNGYGRLSRKTYGDSLAHRFVMRSITGLRPEAWLHECDNPPCCNPLHLTAGDRMQNNQQAWSRGLHPLGEAHSYARLSTAEVAEIRARVAAGQKQSDVAARFGVDQSHISKIVNYRVRKVA